MRGVWIIYRREIAGLFLAPLVWLLLFLALAFNGWYFVLYLRAWDGDVDQAMRLALGGATPYWALMILLPPLITMRMISEEARSGTLEFVLTAPVTDAAVIAGKLAAAATFLSLLWSSALIYAGTLARLGSPPDAGTCWIALCGSVLTSALFCAIGLSASALSSTPLFSAFLAIAANIALFSLRFAGDAILDLLRLPRGHWTADVLRQLDVIAHVEGSFLVGTIDTAHVVFFLAWTLFFAFLAVRLLETRRWR